MNAALAPVAPVPAHQLLVFLLQVGLLLLVAVVLGRLANRAGLPAVVGELCAGILLGPSLLEHVAPALSGWLIPRDPGQLHLLDAVGQIGVLLLVGLTGAHLDLAMVRRRGLTAAQISIFGIVVPLGLGVALAFGLPSMLMGESADRATFALFLGVAMGVSAIPVIAKTLFELKLLHRNIGQLTLCAVMVDDIVGWLLLSIVSAMATSGLHQGDIVRSLLFLLMVLVIAVASRPLLRRLLSRVTSDGTAIAVVTTLVILAAALTQSVGLEAVFGAFLCGLVVSSVKELRPARLAPLRTVVMSVLAPIFFATAGLRMDLTALTDPRVLLAGLAVLAVAIAGKFAGAYTGARLSRLSHWEGLALGAGMNARGVIEVIVAMVGLRLGVLSGDMYTIVVLVAVVTSVMAPPLLRWTMSRVEYNAEEQLREAEAEGRPVPAG